MPKILNLKVLTPNGSILNEEVNQISVKAIDGEIGILPDHTSLITPLAPSVLHYYKNGEIKYAAVLGGMMEVSDNNITIISDHAALAENIDEVALQKEKELHEAQLSQKKDKVDIQKAEIEITKLLTLLHAAELAKKIRSITGICPG